METQTDVVYEVIEPFTHEKFETADRFIPLHHYEKGYNVSETHQTVTRLSQFAHTKLSVVSSWYDDENGDISPNPAEV